jgi:hypothetical protein
MATIKSGREGAPVTLSDQTRQSLRLTQLGSPRSRGAGCDFKSSLVDHGEMDVVTAEIPKLNTYTPFNLNIYLYNELNCWILAIPKHYLASF